VFAAAVPPYLAQTEDNPDGALTKDLAEEMTQGLETDRDAFFDTTARVGLVPVWAVGPTPVRPDGRPQVNHVDPSGAPEFMDSITMMHSVECVHGMECSSPICRGCRPGRRHPRPNAEPRADTPVGFQNAAVGSDQRF
jgi:hypothetical protein